MKSSASELGLRRCCITRQFSGQMERLVRFPVVPPKLAISLAPIGRYRNVRDDPMMAQEDQKKKKWKFCANVMVIFVTTDNNEVEYVQNLYVCSQEKSERIPPLKPRVEANSGSIWGK